MPADLNETIVQDRLLRFHSRLRIGQLCIRHKRCVGSSVETDLNVGDVSKLLKMLVNYTEFVDLRRNATDLNK